MNRPLARRGELVLSMTLAEIFLLLLIVGWYGMRLESEEGVVAPPTPEAILQAELKKAQDALNHSEDARRALERQVEENRKILDWLQDHYGGGPKITLQELQALVRAHEDRIRTEARRGKPTCASSNVLLRVVADGGQTSLDLLETPPFEGNFRRAQHFATGADIDQLLLAVESFYAKRKASKAECAFDYELWWRTDSDYRSARQRFERHFYPARLTQQR
jgi:hypothetical protein